MKIPRDLNGAGRISFVLIVCLSTIFNRLIKDNIELGRFKGIIGINSALRGKRLEVSRESAGQGLRAFTAFFGKFNKNIYVVKYSKALCMRGKVF